MVNELLSGTKSKYSKYKRTYTKRTQIDYFRDRDFKILANRCDICDERLDCPDDIEGKINLLDEINNSYLDDYDKTEPRLLLCSYCQEDYNIASYQSVSVVKPSLRYESNTK
jgi:hypothetical protein